MNTRLLAPARRFTLAVALLPLAAALRAEPPAYAETTAPTETPFQWVDVVRERVPPLTHPRGDRWPLICWEGFGFDPLPQKTIRMLLERGLTQHLTFDAKGVPAARHLTRGGSPLILMDGRGRDWPASLAGDSAEWAHQFDPGYKAKGPWIGACPMMRKGWAVLADEVRRTLGAYRAAGLTVDAVWADWESDPLFHRHLFDQLRHCKRCRLQLDSRVWRDRETWGALSWKLYLQLFGTYLAAPAIEVFPGISVTNWMVVHSTAERPVLTWGNYALPPAEPPMFTATNPVAYGNDEFFDRAWREEWPLDRLHVDRFYTHLLLRQVSADEANRVRRVPVVESVAWISRWCPDKGDPDIPAMSREAYREALRHLWLRGVDAMAVFNPRREGHEEMAVLEVVDAAAVYDEMLAFHDFLERGEVLETDVEGPQYDGVLWSGLRLGDRALVRVVGQGTADASISLEPWAGRSIELEAPRTGRTYIIERGEEVPRAVPR